MNDKLSPALDPAAYLAMAARLASGMGDSAQLTVQADELLAACQGGDYTVMIRYHNSLIISSQLAAHHALQKSMQCDSPMDQQRWLQAAKQAQAMADQATVQVVQLTNTEEKLKPYRQALLAQATSMARTQIMFDDIKAKAERERLIAANKQVTSDDNW